MSERALKAKELMQMFAAQDEHRAYELGFDCGTNGANTENCNFSIFSTPEKTAQWERGKMAADKLKPGAA